MADRKATADLSVAVAAATSAQDDMHSGSQCIQDYSLSLLRIFDSGN
jgi:hypothetical protein